MVNSALEVLKSVADWLVSLIPSFFTLFWTPSANGEGGSLTILGLLCFVALGLGFSFVIIRLIQNFFRLRM